MFKSFATDTQPQIGLPLPESMQTADDSTPSGVELVPEDFAVTKTSPLNIEMTVRNESIDQDNQQVIQERTNVVSQLSLNDPIKLFEEDGELVQVDVPEVSSHEPESKKSTRGRRKSRWKLKFHHQALPPEYLDHYEASNSQKDISSNINLDSRVQKSKVNLQKQQSDADTCIMVKSDRDSPDANNLPKGISQSLLEQLCLPVPLKINVLNRSRNIQTAGERGKCNGDKNVTNKGLLGKLLLEKDKKSSEELKKRSSVIMSSAFNKSSLKPSSFTNTQGNKVVKYQDLPYMGEITLDNMKPRRGRKPKKADICHLIYKNYGTVFSGGPNNPERETMSSLVNTAKVKSDIDMSTNNFRCKALETFKNTTINHIDVQNRIISSLLEKRLTAAASQDFRKNCLENSESYLSLKNLEIPPNVKQESSIDEPLNLCVKDLKQLKIRLLRKHGNYYEPRTDDSAVKTECNDINKADINYEGLLAQDNVSNDSPSQQGTIRSPLGVQLNNEGLTPSDSPNSPLPGGYVYWPNAGVFVHPMALQSQLLYYQKFGSVPLLPLSTPEVPSTFPPSTNLNLFSQNQLFNTIQTKNLSPTSKPSKSVSNKPLVPKSIPVMVESGIKSSVMPSELTFPRMKRIATCSNFPTNGTPAKRKRSAIFIPPMPSENNANPTTEVSICKFKFTGGAKPSLQEKKMLSVDSGGNFRYYSGTGDKSMRGYEFFPRESLQQMGNNIIESSSEVFLTASALGGGDKLSKTNTLKDAGKSSRFETVTSESPASETFPQSTEFGETTRNSSFQQSAKSHVGLELLPAPDAFNAEHFASPKEEIGSKFRLRRKRKTRKSLAREKLEKTFKEKGFLIQTQQLESAEGATYCKFRQLRKFTRYLFRSWKDYLPGNVRDMSVAAGVGGYQESEQEEQTRSSPLTPYSCPLGDGLHPSESPPSEYTTLTNNNQ